jgi:chromosome segregation ATPase
LRVGRYGRDEAECLMGHQAGLNRIYANFDGAEKRLEEVYKKSIEELSIYKRTVQIVQLDEEMKNTIRKLEDQVNALVHNELAKDAKITYLTVNDEKKMREIDQLTLNNDRLNKKMADMERDLNNWKNTVEDFDKIIQQLISENRKLTVEEE